MSIDGCRDHKLGPAMVLLSSAYNMRAEVGESLLCHGNEVDLIPMHERFVIPLS